MLKEGSCFESWYHDKIPSQKEHISSKHRYFQAPKGFFGYRKINWQGVKIHPPVTKPWGNLSKFFSAKVQLLDSHSRNSNFSMDRTACWQCCSGPSPQERDTDTDGDGVCYTFKEIHISVASRQFPLFAEQFPGKRQLQKPLGSSTSTSLVTQNVPLSWSPAKLSARWQKGKRAGSACINKCCFVVAGRTAVFGCNRTAGFFSSGWGSTALRSISLDCFKDPATTPGKASISPPQQLHQQRGHTWQVSNGSKSKKLIWKWLIHLLWFLLCSKSPEV